MKRLYAHRVTPASTQAVVVEFDTHLRAIDPCSHDSDLLLIPGFIDLHNHGANGFDVMDGAEAVVEIGRYHAAHGTLAFAPTTMTASIDAIEFALNGIAQAMQTNSHDSARILGAHLEGPFISDEKLGAQPEYTLAPDTQLVRRFGNMAPIAIATIAPELEGADLIAAVLQARGTRVQIGHTNCSAAQANHALTAGFAGFTHLFNAMSGFAHRKAGAASSALAYAQWAEIICDLHHVERDAILAARRAIEGCYAVTDSTAATGCDDGAFKLGEQSVYKRGCRVELADGTLAGSCITMHEAFKNLFAIGLPLEECVAWCCSRPAAYLHQQKAACLNIGDAASFVVLSGIDLSIVAVAIDGQLITGAL